MNPIVWAILLMVIGLALVVLEIFIPSGGILGFLAVVSVVGSIFMAFSGAGTTIGFAFVAIAMVGLPTAVVLALKWLPETPIGRRLLLGVPTDDDVLPEDDPRHRLQKLVGRQGTAKTDMRPGGNVIVAGETYEAVSESGPIDLDQAIEVVLVRNNRLVVRIRTDGAPSGTDGNDDPLSQPIDSLGIDPFDEPLS